MIFDIFRTKAGRLQKERDLELYTRLVKQARNPALFMTFGVPDTLDGRYEMVVLHVFLFCHRLKQVQSPLKERSQRIFDLMVQDMDSALREMGVGDLSVAKKIKPMIEIFYGRTGAYNEALQNDDNTALAEALQRNIYARVNNAADYASRLALYVRESVTCLAALDDEQLRQGIVQFASLDVSEAPSMRTESYP